MENAEAHGTLSVGTPSTTTIVSAHAYSMKSQSALQGAFLHPSTQRQKVRTSAPTKFQVRVHSTQNPPIIIQLRAKRVTNNVTQTNPYTHALSKQMLASVSARPSPHQIKTRTSEGKSPPPPRRRAPCGDARVVFIATYRSNNNSCCKLQEPG